LLVRRAGGQPRDSSGLSDLLNPRRGLLVLEVKDWKADTIRSIDRFSVTLLIDGRQKQTANPLEQAKQYAYGVKDVLERDPALLSEPGTPYPGRTNGVAGSPHSGLAARVAAPALRPL
jgi:hypothetical protein